MPDVSQQGPREPSIRERLDEIRESVVSGRYKFNEAVQADFELLLRTVKMCQDSFRRIGTRHFNGTPSDAVEMLWILTGEDVRPEVARLAESFKQ